MTNLEVNRGSNLEINPRINHEVIINIFRFTKIVITRFQNKNVIVKIYFIIIMVFVMIQIISMKQWLHFQARIRN